MQLAGQHLKTTIRGGGRAGSLAPCSWRHRSPTPRTDLSLVVPCAEPARREAIQGYTPANYISYTSGEQHRCYHMVAVDVDAPPAVCFALWYDWTRLVDFLDLVAQIGLDPEEPQMGLFQCFYRWGRMPIMEIVFLARRTRVEPYEHIAFDTLWGMPASGEVNFVGDETGQKTRVYFKFMHQLPWLLVDLKVGVLAVQEQMHDILAENMEEFKAVAEREAAAAAERAPPGTTPQKPAPTSQAAAEPEAPPAAPAGRASRRRSTSPSSAQGKAAQARQAAGRGAANSAGPGTDAGTPPQPSGSAAAQVPVVGGPQVAGRPPTPAARAPRRKTVSPKLAAQEQPPPVQAAPPPSPPSAGRKGGRGRSKSTPLT